ncbi:hypothetical protein [Kribbella shirazensis]|uniref:Uncharacterized protein n=1 Tax=Kribbella shirazensis TaxID=1105143 RepID=A0A7X6A4C7_9ACTN|nr:hypothetical protein [Kribbella shirazensis]NIK60169.1 hypothetical protein [Kribbella shirazensis]
MPDEPRAEASAGYAMRRLEHAFERALTADDAAVRRRAAARVEAWRNVLDGMASGRLTVGSRTPVADTPAWVTLEVVTGGFATGRYLAEVPLRDEELARIPADAPGATDRERLNLWYLGDEGLAELGQVLRTGRYRVDVPEESALLVVAWLLEHEHFAAALDLVAELRPLMDRLRFTPTFSRSGAPSGSVVRLQPVAETRAALLQATVPPQLQSMRETLQIWNPLYDRLVELWCDTVEDELPALTPDGVTGGWPCRRWPDNWAQRRRRWLDDYRAAAAVHQASNAHRHPKSNFARLHSALQRCPEDSSALNGRDVGWIRRALANTIQPHGAPGSESRAALRAVQGAVAARPTYAAVARVLSARLDRFPADGGLPTLDPIAVEVTEAEDAASAGASIPAHLLAKTARSLEAPIGELVERGVITSGEVLARVLPQVTSQLLAANIQDAALASVYAQTYAAFRRRRSLLLLNLEHQVRFDELPWVAAVAPLRERKELTTHAAVQSLRETTMTALGAFPHAILPNPLVREFGALASQAGLKLPLVEEVAADIFMGTFTQKWREAAVLAGRVLSGTLYARYYDVPDVWAPVEPPQRGKRLRIRWGKPVAEDFAAECRRRAEEAQTSQSGGYVAENGTVLEQSKILTTHNLAVLIEALHLTDWLRDAAPDLAHRTFAWAIDRQTQPASTWITGLQSIKNTAYAWRQAIFYLSFCDSAAQREVLAQVADRATVLGPRFAPAVDGLAAVAAGERFDAAGRTAGGGRRLLGWSSGPHWCMPRVKAQPSGLKT